MALAHVVTGQDVRSRCRSNSLVAPTAGLAPGYLQANLLVLPSSAAADFRDLCARNPVPFPLLGYSQIEGDYTRVTPDTLVTQDLDLRTDLPQYNIYNEGKLVSTKNDVVNDWKPDHVAFLIGCSFSFDNALVHAGLQPRHLQQKCNVPMYVTSRRLSPAGVFDDGTWVVSMRPYRADAIEEVRRVTRPFMKTHGEPVAWGWESVVELGIQDITRPEYGDSVTIEEGELPVFWGCGVTPQVAVMAAAGRVKGTILAHRPGHMLVLDVNDNAEL